MKVAEQCTTTLVQKVFFFLSSRTKLTREAATTSLREKPVVLVTQRLVVAHEEKE